MCIIRTSIDTVTRRKTMTISTSEEDILRGLGKLLQQTSPESPQRRVIEERLNQIRNPSMGIPW